MIGGINVSRMRLNPVIVFREISHSLQYVPSAILAILMGPSRMNGVEALGSSSVLRPGYCKA